MTNCLSDYVTLCKPRVVMLMILTSIVGMCLAPVDYFSWKLFFLGNIGIALMACSAAAVNHLVDRHIDRLMRRTENRPIAQGAVTTKQAIIFAITLCVMGLYILIAYVNTLTAILTFLTLIGYAGIYTFYLKHATPQNIVIGGLAGAAPPLLGWVAMTGHVGLGAIVLLLIIFVWTPPHFWALAIDRVEDYKKAKVPMLPVTHGILHTKKNIFWYTIALSAVSLLPYFIGLSQVIYLVIVIVLDARFVQLAWRLLQEKDAKSAMPTFRYSIVYLMALFVALIVDHYIFV
ncbi:MAG: heme o synthase [Coxiellaceae bacterium]|nr:heme o synthase [Coxiellaceae bacterium]